MEDRRALERCPCCGDGAIRYSYLTSRHVLRRLIGSRKRYCLNCGARWLGRRGRGLGCPLSRRERYQVVGRALVAVVTLALFYVPWSLEHARQVSAQSQAQAFMAYHARYVQALRAKSSAEGYRRPFASQLLKASSSFGYRLHPILQRLLFHRGLDFPLPYGTPVFAARDGRIVEAGWDGGYGLRVVVRHPDSETTIYGHLSRITARSGDSVEAGLTMLGRVGSTGLSTGPHLHFELHDAKGRAIDPTYLISGGRP